MALGSSGLLCQGQLLVAFTCRTSQEAEAEHFRLADQLQKERQEHSVAEAAFNKAQENHLEAVQAFEERHEEANTDARIQRDELTKMKVGVWVTQLWGPTQTPTLPRSPSYTRPSPSRP